MTTHFRLLGNMCPLQQTTCPPANPVPTDAPGSWDSPQRWNSGWTPDDFWPSRAQHAEVKDKVSFGGTASAAPPGLSREGVGFRAAAASSAGLVHKHAVSRSHQAAPKCSGNLRGLSSLRIGREGRLHGQRHVGQASCCPQPQGVQERYSHRQSAQRRPRAPQPHLCHRATSDFFCPLSA